MRAVERTNTQAGFSLPELLVCLTVMLVVMGAVASQVKSAFQISNATYEVTEVQQGLRFAQEYLNRDLLSSGDGLRGITNIRVRTLFVQNYLTNAPVPSTEPGYVTMPVITSDDNVSGATPVRGANPAANILGGTDRVTLLLIDPNFQPVSLTSASIASTGASITVTQAQYAARNFRVGEIYFVNSLYGATFGTITSITGPTSANPVLNFANGDVYGLNLTGNLGTLRFVSRGTYDGTSGTPQPATLVRMQVVQYFVNQNGLLVRRVFGTRGNGFTDSPITDNVTDFQIRYFLNDTAQSVNSLTTSIQQQAVRQLEINVTAETEHPVLNGERQSVTATSSSSVRNLQFHRAL